MGSKKIVAAVLTAAFLAGCTMRTQAPTSITAHDFPEREAYGQSFAASPTYAGQDTSWTTSAPARAMVGFWQQKSPAAEVAQAKAKNADEGAEGKFDGADDDQSVTPVARPAPAPVIVHRSSPPVQGGQSTALPGVGTSGR